jgi:GNAT superfamily N-acetyltransferase
LLGMVDRRGGARIEKSLAAQARDYAIDHRAILPEHGAEVLEVGGAGGGFAVWGSKRGAPNVSRAFALGIDGEVKADELARVEDFYARHGARARVVTSPWTHASLFELLAARGFRVASHDNILTRDIDGDARPSAPGVTVTRVVPTPEAVLAWGRIVRVGFDMDAEDERFVLADRVFERSTTATLYTGSVGGEPAGGSALDLRDGMATLFATSTLPAFRRRGVQGALIAARLAYALEQGADLAVVITSPGSDSQRNLETRYGFRVGYTIAVFEAPHPG